MTDGGFKADNSVFVDQSARFIYSRWDAGSISCSESNSSGCSEIPDEKRYWLKATKYDNSNGRREILFLSQSVYGTNLD